jgi:glutamate synthase (NADPH) large chain
MHCLGANRVGFGTLAMVSLGCTICRGCQLDTCHVGIATQIESKHEADMKGLKKFTPQDYERAAESCARFFSAMGEEVRSIAASLGYERAQDLVGRSDLLVQSRMADRVDVGELIRPLEELLELEPIDLPMPDEDRQAPGLVVARPIRMREKETSRELAALATEVCAGTAVRREWPEPTDADDRVLGTELAGELARARIFRGGPPATEDVLAQVRFDGGSVAGQGLGAFNVHGVDITVQGGAQDGVAKTMLGGKVSVLKGLNERGERVNGSVGKSFAYGAQRGRLFVQGDADSRFCIRLSGADVVVGGEPHAPLRDDLGCCADRANLKGFAFEYMTAGRAVVLGDPGPWFCAGQTGGRVYLRVNDDWHLTREALEARKGEGAKVTLKDLDAEGVLDVQELLGHYAEELRASDQQGEADRVLSLASEPERHFVMSVPEKEQTDPSISTE